MRFLPLVASFVFSVALFGDCGAVDMSGSVTVNQTSDTAANAKIDATNFARRQILSNVLSKYADVDSLNDLLQNTPSDELVNLIESSSVSNEHISSNGYTATILMNIDNDATKKWLDSNNVRNWIPESEIHEKFKAFIVVPNGIADWADIKRAARENNIELETQVIKGNQILVNLPVNVRSKFTASIRDMGWKYADNGGVLQIWK